MRSSTTLQKEATTDRALCFRGLDNGGYYLLEADRSRYARLQRHREYA